MLRSDHQQTGEGEDWQRPVSPSRFSRDAEPTRRRRVSVSAEEPPRPLQTSVATVWPKVAPFLPAGPALGQAACCQETRCEPVTRVGGGALLTRSSRAQQPVHLPEIAHPTFPFPRRGTSCATSPAPRQAAVALPQ